MTRANISGSSPNDAADDIVDPKSVELRDPFADLVTDNDLVFLDELGALRCA